MLTKEAVLKALSTVLDSDLRVDLVTLKMIEDLEVDGDTASFSIVLTTPACPLLGQIEKDARRAVQTMAGAKEVRINTISRVQSPKSVDNDTNHFNHVIAVGSGKGGVGKSTVAVALATRLAAQGAKVGLLDADIYGPNIPRMLGIDRLPEGDGPKIRTAEVMGMKVVSIGFLVQDGQPLIWRGPMLHTAIKQFLTDFDWGDLDYFVVDLPPGTGDVQLSLAQSLPISGAVVVTTPQQVSVDDAYRAISMFDKLEVPVLGIVENMAYLEMPDGSHLHVFGEAGGEHLANRAGVPFLGRIPLDPAVAQGGDIGSPATSLNVSSATSEAYDALTCTIAAEMSKTAFKQ